MPDEKVGYGKPPRSGRFVKGRSGNPKGRPKDSINIATKFNGIIRKKVTVKVNGRMKTMTRIEAVFHQMVNRAMSGDPRAMRELVRFSCIFKESEDRDDLETVPHERDHAAFQSVLRRMQRMANTTQIESVMDEPSIKEPENNESESD